MQHTFTWSRQYIFKPLLLGYLFQLFTIFGLGARLLALYAQTGATHWMIAVGGCVVIGSLLVWRYQAELVVIENGEVVIYRWLAQPIVVSIALNDLQVRQTMISRLFDSGALYIELNGRQRKLASIGMANMFQGVVAERHDVIRQLLVAQRQRMQAEEREIGVLLGQMLPQR